jgi:hypothetical protein
MREQIEERLSVLVGIPLRYMGRAATMLWVGFGDYVVVSDLNGEKREVAEYALHLQCPWRLIEPRGIITGATDLFHASEEPYRELEDGEWDKKVGDHLYVTLCDARIEAFFAEHGDDTLIVESVTADDVGSLRIALKDGYAIEVFPDDSLPGEHWRFFGSGDFAPHLVITGMGIEPYDD